MSALLRWLCYSLLFWLLPLFFPVLLYTCFIANKVVYKVVQREKKKKKSRMFGLVSFFFLIN